MSHKTNDLSKFNSIFKAKEVPFKRFFRERSNCKMNQIDFKDFLEYNIRCRKCPSSSSCRPLFPLSSDCTENFLLQECFKMTLNQERIAT